MSLTTERTHNDLVDVASAAGEEVGETLVVESCASIWIFAPARRSFRRILRGLAAQGCPIVTDWRPYHSLEFDPDFGFFVVWLDPEGTRMLRSWRHTEPCGRCD